MFHTYIDWTDDKRPFYVGMGDDNRIRVLSPRNKRYGHVANKHGRHREIVRSFENRADAISLEVLLISKHHTFVDDPSYNGIGCNYTIGGEGCACSEETKQKMRNKIRDQFASGRTVLNKGKILGPAPLEWRLKQSAAQMGKAPTKVSQVNATLKSNYVRCESLTFAQYAKHLGTPKRHAQTVQKTQSTLSH